MKIECLTEWLNYFDSQTESTRSQVEKLQKEMVNCQARRQVFQNMKKWYPEAEDVADEQINFLEVRFQQLEDEAKVKLKWIDDYYEKNAMYIQSIKTTMNQLKG